MTIPSFSDHMNAFETFLRARRELRFLIEHGIEAAQAFTLIIRAYPNPLMLRYYAPTLHVWSLKPAPVLPPALLLYEPLAQFASLEEELQQFDLMLLTRVDQEIMLPAEVTNE